LGVKKSTVFKAQEIVEKYRLTPRDAIHAAAAIDNKIATIVSYDKDFDILDEIRRIEP
jgi:predicted nucleic acid-binding protein